VEISRQAADLMKKWTLVDKAETPDGKILSLHERDDEFTIRVDGVDLMSTRQHASEERLAELACAHVEKKSGARVLIGGLGFGFTLAAALRALPPDAVVVVAELMDAVIAWNRNPAYGLAAELMADKRVEIHRADVARAISGSSGPFDAIILDVDNGPAALSMDANRGLYSQTGLRRLVAALRPGGCAAIWSATADPGFAKRMSDVGFSVKIERSRAHATSGGWHTLFLGRI
jgi:spermidine synthase